MSSRSYFTRYWENVPCFKIIFFLFAVVKWNKICKSKNQKVLIWLKKAFENLCEYLKEVFITAITLKELHY